MDDHSGDDGQHRNGDGEAETPPLAELAERIRRKRDETDRQSELPADDPVVDPNEVFAEQPVGEIDSDLLWELLGDEPSEKGTEGEPPVVSGDNIVPKRWYCERCEYFSAPPEVHCNHDGTTIVEFVGMEHVRVRDCPVVAERRALGEYPADEEDSISID